MSFKEAPEGIVVQSNSVSGFIDTNDVLGTKYKNVEITALSKNRVESLDLLSEGLIDGLVSGTYTFSGNLGEIGYRSGSFVPYKIPDGYTGVQYLRSIYWNEIPVLDESGRFNFQSINVSVTPGKPNGETIQTLSPYQKTSRTVGERLRKGFPKTYRILNKDCRGVIVNVKIPTMSETKESDGSIMRVTIEYNLSYKPIFNDRVVGDFILARKEQVFGKIVAGNGYVRSTRIDFTTDVWGDDDFIGWEIKIERTTDESTSSLLRNQTFIDSLTEIQGNIYTYPNSAMVRSLFDAEYFQSIPSRAFDTQLIKVQIPGNYNPILRTYSTTGFATTNGGWDGTFATGKYWTNNPAWCFYDLLTNRRYGLGKYIDPNFVDKWNLYNIAQYCDTLVSDGEGGLEPRFTSNVWITSKDDAYKVVNDMASIFRGLTYYANGLIYAIQDSPQNPLTVFNNTNVENGDFIYSSTPKKSRHSVAIIRYNDPLNFYKPAIEYVEDLDSIRKYGVRELELTAFGCTSRAQAIRLGRWAILSENMETETVSFSAGLEANYLKPGDVFKVFDVNKKVKRHAGRAISVNNVGSTGATVTLDSTINLEPNVGYVLSVVTPSYYYNPSQVSGLTSNDISGLRRSFIQTFNFTGFQTHNNSTNTNTIIDLYQPFDNINYYVSGRPIWSLEIDNNYINAGYTGLRYFTDPSYDYFKVLSVTENEDYKFQIVGLQYVSDKYVEIESGLVLQRNNLITNKVPATPYGLNFNTYQKDDGLKVINYSFLVDNYTNINSYKVYISDHGYPNNGVPNSDLLAATLPVDNTSSEYIPLNSGYYNFRIYSSNDVDNYLSSSFASGGVTIGETHPIYNVLISSLRIDSYTGAYTGSSSTQNVTLVNSNDTDPTYSWQVGFKNSQVINTNLKYRFTIRTLDQEGSRIPTDSIVFEKTGLTDTSYQFSLDDNVNLPGGPYRSYQAVVEAHDSDGYTSAGNIIGQTPENGWSLYSAGYDIIDYNNPRQTGIELGNNIPTLISGNGDYYTGNSLFYSRQYIGSNGEAIISFSSGQFTNDTIGGYLYLSPEPFAKLEALIPNSYSNARLKKTRFSFNPYAPDIHVPTAAFNVRGFPFCFGSVQFFDEIDQAIIDKGIDISSGLYLSNNALFYNDSAMGSITLGNVTILSVTTTGYPGAARVIQLIGSGTEITRSSTSGTANVTGNFTTLIYVTVPFTGIGYTGYSLLSGSQGGGIGGNSTTNIQGTQPYGFRFDTCISNGSLVSPSWIRISDIRVGNQANGTYVVENVGVGTQPINFDPSIDNWTTFFSGDGNTSIANGGTCQRVTRRLTNTWYQINFTSAGLGTGAYYVTAEQPIYMINYKNGSEISGYRFHQAKNIYTGVNQNYTFTSGFAVTGSYTDFYSFEQIPHKVFMAAPATHTGLLGSYVDQTLGGSLFHNSIYNY